MSESVNAFRDGKNAGWRTHNLCLLNKKNVANAESEEAIREFKYFKRNKDLEQLLWGMGKEKK